MNSLPQLVFAVSSRGYSWWCASLIGHWPERGRLNALASSFLELLPTQALFPSHPDSCYSSLVVTSILPEGAKLMEWTTPKHEEIDLNCEVSSYANAEL
jgi:hypothetical protein